MAATSHLFGPVPSRRLGRSLGLDLLPLKTCTYDCVYCQLGRTTDRTVQRRQYVPLGEVLAELEAALAAGVSPDYLTLAGSGEPTLFRPLDELLAGIKRITAVPVAVLTNGSLLWDPRVREELSGADLVMPSLDAVDERLFQRLNRPHPQITFERLVNGLAAFRRDFSGAYWLEVMVLAGSLETPEQRRSLGALVDEITPDRVLLNTVARPPVEGWVRAASAATLAASAAALGPRAEIVADYLPAAVGARAAGAEEAVLALLQRRPCRLEDLCAGLGLHPNEVVKYLTHLLHARRVHTRVCGTQTFYAAASGVGSQAPRGRQDSELT